MRASVAALAVILFARAASAQSTSVSTATSSGAIHHAVQTVAQAEASVDAGDNSATAYLAMLYEQMLVAYWITAYYGSIDTSASADSTPRAAPYASEAWFSEGATATAMPAWYYSSGTALTNTPAATVANGAMTQGAGTNDAAALTVDDRVPSTTPDGHRVSIYSVAGGRAAMTPEPSTPAPTTAPRSP